MFGGGREVAIERNDVKLPPPLSSSAHANLSVVADVQQVTICYAPNEARTLTRRSSCNVSSLGKSGLRRRECPFHSVGTPPHLKGEGGYHPTLILLDIRMCSDAPLPHPDAIEMKKSICRGSDCSLTLYCFLSLSAACSKLEARELLEDLLWRVTALPSVGGRRAIF